MTRSNQRHGSRRRATGFNASQLPPRTDSQQRRREQTLRAELDQLIPDRGPRQVHREVRTTDDEGLKRLRNRTERLNPDGTPVDEPASFRTLSSGSNNSSPSQARHSKNAPGSSLADGSNSLTISDGSLGGP